VPVSIRLYRNANTPVRPYPGFYSVNIAAKTVKMDYCPCSHTFNLSEISMLKKLIFAEFIDILILSMFVRNFVKILSFLAVLAFFASCEDAFLPSAGTYKLNARANGVLLDECSFVGPTDKIYPYFEESVSNDPDVTALTVFLRNSSGEITGRKIKYSLDEQVEEDETLVQVRNLDYNLPFFPLPENFPVGRYTMVLQVMSGSDILQRTEKIFYNMGNTVFSYEGISVHFPGITGNPQIIPKETVLMLEVQLDFSSRLDPYIVWYNGRRKVSEGKFSDGAGFLFWTAPDQSGFFSIRAEVFPTDAYFGLAGYQKEVSLLVSSKTTDAHLVSGNNAQLVHWYVFEGNLNDSKMKASAERAVKSSANKTPKWVSANGTYGVAAGPDNVYTLPKVNISNYETEIWQAVFRFMPLNEGQIFSVLFEDHPDVSMKLNMEGQNLVLRLASPGNTVSQIVRVPEKKSFLTAGIKFSILPDQIAAKINIIEDSVEQGELASKPILLEVGIKNNFQILLGDKNENAAVSVSRSNAQFTAIWDEFALYNAPSMEVLAQEIKQSAGYKQPELDTYISY
jgi:hypothetical protein